jgi:hypothetical protein
MNALRFFVALAIITITKWVALEDLILPMFGLASRTLPGAWYLGQITHACTTTRSVATSL